MSAAYAMSTVTRPDRPALRGPQELPASPLAPGRAPPATAQPVVAFVTPLPGFAINSPFGMRRMPWEEGGRLHEGVDMAAPTGQPVAATLPGLVARIGTSPSYGRFVEVAHGDGLVSFYAHLSRPARGLKPGVPVSGGQTLGYVGGSGRSTGSHLHFEIRHHDRPLNPVFLIGRRFASLDSLPFKEAARVSGQVRVAVVSGWSPGVRRGAAGADGRVRSVINPAVARDLVRSDAVAPPLGLRAQALRIEGLRALAQPTAPNQASGAVERLPQLKIPTLSPPDA
jgi:hypothetical protein